MQASRRATTCSSHIVAFDTTSKNGSVLAFGKLKKSLRIYCLMMHRPANTQELFNLRHASARNVVERIFGVLKRRFKILIMPPEYSMSIQKLIPPALCALHNFIREYDPDDLAQYMEPEPMDMENVGALGSGPPGRAERERANNRRDQIAAGMWAQYQQTIGGM
jgi:hypothetical protein